MLKERARHWQTGPDSMSRVPRRGTIGSVCLVVCVCVLIGAVPRAYESELLCRPRSGCLRFHERPRTWTGPDQLWLECCDSSTGEVSEARGRWRRWAGQHEVMLGRLWGGARTCSAAEARVCDKAQITQAAARAGGTPPRAWLPGTPSAPESGLAGTHPRSRAS